MHHTQPKQPVSKFLRTRSARRHKSHGMHSTVAPALSKEEELHWLALKLVPGLGTRRAFQIVERYRTPMALFRASRSELNANGLPGSLAQTIASGCIFEDAVDQQQKMLNCGATLIPLFDPRYPPRLREIFDPPVVLFARGRVDLLQSTMLGV